MVGLLDVLEEVSGNGDWLNAYEFTAKLLMFRSQNKVSICLSSGLSGQPVEQVEDFKYLASVFQNNGGIDADVTHTECEQDG